MFAVDTKTYLDINTLPAFELGQLIDLVNEYEAFVRALLPLHPGLENLHDLLMEL